VSGSTSLPPVWNKTATLWEVPGGKLKTFQGHTSYLQSVALRDDGKFILTGSADKTAILWEGATGKIFQTFKGHSAAVNSAAMSGDAKLVLTGSADNTAILWQSLDGKKLQTLQGHGGPVTSVTVSKDGKHLWTASIDGTTRLWDPAIGKERCRLYSLDAGKDWLVVTPEGFFDGSPGAWRFVTYRNAATGTLVDDDATRRRFHRPGLLARVWKGEPLAK